MVPYTNHTMKEAVKIRAELKEKQTAIMRKPFKSSSDILRDHHLTELYGRAKSSVTSHSSVAVLPSLVAVINSVIIGLAVERIVGRDSIPVIGNSKNTA